MNLENLINNFSELALKNIATEYPSKISHSLSSKNDLKEPHELYPIFYGSYDWHSSVHNHWLLVKSIRNYFVNVDSNKIIQILDSQFTKEKAEGELEYLLKPINKGFERPYGWGWFLKLLLEIKLLEIENARKWEEALNPIGDFFVREFKEFLPKLEYPIRVGVHSNSAFGLNFALEFAKYVRDEELINLINESAKGWFLKDSNMQVLEPNGDEFLSPTLIEALLLSKILKKDEFKKFFCNFLPNLNKKEPKNLFEVVRVSDRSDGKIAHLDGLNLSRAWCFREIAKLCDEDVAKILLDSANEHLEDALKHIETDYMGAHWLGSFALLALEA